MRSDMFKVIVERPRKWKRAASDARQLREDMDGAMSLGMRRGYGRPWLNENLNPLHRFLQTQVGRPWSKVYSELCERIDRRNTVQQHVLQHVGDFVAIHTWRDDDELRFHSSGCYSGPQRLAEARQLLFVDPSTGILRKRKLSARHPTYQDRLRAKEAEIAKRRRKVSETEQLHCLDGLWFSVALAILPELNTSKVRRRPGSPFDDRRWDAVRNAYVSRRDFDRNLELFGSPYVFAVSRRQLGKKDLRRYGL